jgi:5'-nucleotidase
MHILVSNDDGIHAPGLHALAQAVLPLGQVTVIAPLENQSATGHKRTFHQPLRILPQPHFLDGVTAYAVTGSPADCTAVAVLGFLEQKVDLVVSGVNRGPNAAQDVTYSGTVAVTLEAAIFGLPALAFSLDNRASDADYSHCIPIARHLTEVVLREGLPTHTILNVNIPASTPKGIKITRQGLREYRDTLIRRQDPYGQPYFWVGGQEPIGDVEAVDTDLWALHHGYVSVTPIHLDMTAHHVLNTLQSWRLA